MSTATLVKTIPSMRGDAAVYKLDPPWVEHPYFYEGAPKSEDITHEFVVVSAVDLDYGGFSMDGLRTSETMIFPSNGEKTSDWGELAMVPHKSHADALAELGYTIAPATVNA